MDLETELYQLEQRMALLVKYRGDFIRKAEASIERANRDFDEVAVPLGQQINELRDRLKKEDKPADKTSRSHKPAALDGLDDEDQAHYLELLAKKRRK